MNCEAEIKDLHLATDLATDLADALREVVAQHGPEVARQPPYLSLRPAERYIAAYFKREPVDVVGTALAYRAAGAHWSGG